MNTTTQQVKANIIIKNTTLHWIKKSFNIFLYVICLLFLLEISLQCFYYVNVGQWLFSRTHVPLYVPNKYSIWWNRPHLNLPHHTPEFHTMIFTNSQGLRVPEEQGDYLLGKQPDVTRILLLGPSFAFGWGVNYEQSFASKLETLLQKNRLSIQSRVEVINAGVPTMGPLQNLNWYNHVGKKFAPDLVIQFIYGSMVVPKDSPWNDVKVTTNGDLVQKHDTFKHRLIAQAKNSGIVFYGWLLSTKLRTYFNQNTYQKHIEGARDITLYGKFDISNQEVIKSLAYYNKLRASTEKMGTKLLIIYFPLSYAIHHEDTIRWQASQFFVKDIKSQLQYDNEFCQFLNKQGFSCLNITDALQKAAKKNRRLYYYVDTHWTPAGNLFAASTVSKYIENRRLMT